MISATEWSRLYRQAGDFGSSTLSTFLTTLLREAPIAAVSTPDSWRELMSCLGDLEEVLEVHLFSAHGDDDVDQAWVVVNSVTPDSIRHVTDILADVEREFEELFDIRVVPDGVRIPGGLHTFLVKDV